MNSYKSVSTITGWLVFAIAAVVYYLTAEATGSLWDCGEFILGAYKMEVVHPPGAPLFMIIGRMFIFIAETFSDTEAHPENIAFAVNVMSGVCTALGAMFLSWITIILGKFSLVGRDGQPDTGQTIALAGAGLVAGLSMTFASSVWFSAVEGEVYAMSTFFTCLTMWAMIKWYALPDEPKHDRWIIFAIFSAGLSIGVHLLSLLTFPALALFYYYKRYKNHNWVGMLAAAGVGVLLILAMQVFVITGIATVWQKLELLMVNSFGMPFFSGLFPTLLLVAAIFIFGFRYTSKKNDVDLAITSALLGLFLFINFDGFSKVFALAAVGLYYGMKKAQPHVLEVFFISALLSVAGFSTIGVILVRASADPPVNMNRPSDPIRLLSYVNREQYGERPLLYGPHFDASPYDNQVEQRYGQVIVDGKPRYEITDEKLSYLYQKSDKQLFPRMGDDSQNRPEKYRAWIDKPAGTPNFFDNLKFTFRYQLGWMYWRYFAWNFIGRQNGEQGYYSWDKKSGHWESGIKFIDEARLFNMDKMPDQMKNDPAKNHYYFLPFIFGLLGVFFHFKKRPEEAIGLMALFVITGIGIIIYSNQPPNEPRERDYVLAGSFLIFGAWIGMGVLAIYNFLANKIPGVGGAVVASALVLTAPIIMGMENWDDHSRAGHYASRDYAANFLNSCEENAIIFTYGDNDTYPLWYAQEVENIRTDVRVVNLSLIQVDWYINLLRRKVNNSPPIKLTIPADSYRGKKRNAVFHYDPNKSDKPMSAVDFLKFIGEEHELRAGDRTFESFMPTKNVYLDFDSTAAVANGTYNPADSIQFVSRVPLAIPDRQYMTKDELAVLDVIASNINDRPVYFAVTCRPEKMFGLADYMKLEGLSLRIVPEKSKSEQGMFIYGFGRADTEKIFDNIMTKWKWGNFDTHPTYIDRSYGPSLQSMRIVMLRTARRLNDQGKKEKAIQLVEKYLAAFPNYNFTYDWNTMQLLNEMIRAGGYEKAKPHIEILVEETVQQLAFLNSIDSKFKAKDGDFEQEEAFSQNVMDLVLKAVGDQKDEAYLKQLEERFAPYRK